MIVWCDVETTGLEPTEHALLEVAIVVTDDMLNALGAFTVVTNVAREIPFASMDPYVQAMHTKNGLWLESLTSEHSLAECEAALDAFLLRECGTIADQRDRPPLGGSGVHFDRAFLKRHMPSLMKRLHYRNLDVSAFVETSKRFWPEVYAARPHVPEDQKIHRAYPDIVESIEHLKYFRRNLGPVAEAPAARTAGVDLLDARGVL